MAADEFRRQGVYFVNENDYYLFEHILPYLEAALSPFRLSTTGLAGVMMNASMPTTEQPPARMVAGALAHLARHMETGCQRSAYLAAMLLEKVANDAEADDHLRRHARELVEILDRDHEAEAETGTALALAATRPGDKRLSGSF